MSPPPPHPPRSRRRARRADPNSPAPARPSRRSPPSVRRWGLAALALALIAGAWLARTRPWAPARGAGAGAQAKAFSDSLLVATERDDFGSALAWARTLAALEPGNAIARFNLGIALRNQLMAPRSRTDTLRPPVRTSLERLRLAAAALDVLDSALALSRTPETWTQAAMQKGNVFEYLGLPIEALAVYQAVNRRFPDFTPAAQRTYGLGIHLANPLAPMVLTLEPAGRPLPGPRP
ncbi:MAG: hypothetical protein A2W00_02105 [Candidatus Eisenbacteria bacterium RBG_16_71_46]|nr:MAG: hypothetical protein A2W00_02105 [Candidatus Eisenbacteria bacterium RBG_16_71_46]